MPKLGPQHRTYTVIGALAYGIGTWTKHDIHSVDFINQVMGEVSANDDCTCIVSETKASDICAPTLTLDCFTKNDAKQ